MQPQKGENMHFGVFRKLSEIQNQISNQDKIILKNPFFLKESPKEPIHLSLAHDFILLQQNSSPAIYGVQFCFEVKFRILKHDTKTNASGIQLFHGDSDQFINLYSNNNKVIEQWKNELLKKINYAGFHNLFKAVKKLGRGTFAAVFEIERYKDGKKFAAKAFAKQNLYSAQKGKQCIKHQIKILRSIHHQNLLKLEGVFESENSLYIVYELLKGGTLLSLQNKIPKNKLKLIMRGLMKGIQHLHEKKIVHRDLKLENIMFRQENYETPVIIDFGLSTYFNQDKHIYIRCGTPGYVAPEILNMINPENPKFYPESDMFSIGVIFYYLLTGEPLFGWEDHKKIFENNKNMNYDLEQVRKQMTEQEYDFLCGLLEKDHGDRISSESGLKHEYFSGKVVSPATTNAIFDQDIDFLEIQ